MSLESWLRSRSDRCSGCGFEVKVQGCRCPGSEWARFVAALRQAKRVDGTIHQRDVRPIIRGRIAPKHIGQMYQRARAEHLIDDTGCWEDSDDLIGKNRHKPERIWAWHDEAA